MGYDMSGEGSVGGGGDFVTIDDLRSGPMRAVVQRVFKTIHGFAVELDNGRACGLNVSSINNLKKSFGDDSDDWLGKLVVISLVRFGDREGKVVRADQSNDPPF